MRPARFRPIALFSVYVVHKRNTARHNVAVGLDILLRMNRTVECGRRACAAAARNRAVKGNRARRQGD